MTAKRCAFAGARQEQCAPTPSTALLSTSEAGSLPSVVAAVEAMWLLASKLSLDPSEMLAAWL